MKKMITLLLLAVTFTVSAQTYMPDDAFEAWCETLGYGDGILNNDTIDAFAASVVPQLNLDNVGISDLTGIEAFTSCHTINVANNTLSNIDVSFFGNTLIYFNATNNNDDLYCITVSDTSYAVLQTILGPYSIDSITSFSTNCATAFGCMDPLGCNYNSFASIDTVTGGSCFYNIDTIFTGVDVCDQFTWNFNGGAYTTSGTYHDTLTTVDGCDSVGEINITIRNSTESNTYDTICDITVWNNLIVDTSGTYGFNMPNTNAVGCDSTAWLHAVVNYKDETTITHVDCDSYQWKGINYTSTGLYQHDTITVNGCDSTIYLDLTIDNSHIYIHTIAACNSYTWINGNTYTLSNSTDSFMYQTVVG